MVIAAVAAGAKGYCGLSDRISRVEAMQRLVLKKNGYREEEIEKEIQHELNNHNKWSESKRRPK